MPEVLDTAKLGPIKIEPPKPPHDRLSLLERVNNLNIAAVAKGSKDKFWTCTVLYNTVIWRAIDGDVDNAVMFETYKGVFKK